MRMCLYQQLPIKTGIILIIVLLLVQQAVSINRGITEAPLVYTSLEWQPSLGFGTVGNFYYFKNRIGLETAFRFKVKVLLLNLGVGWFGGLNPNQARAFNYSFATGLEF